MSRCQGKPGRLAWLFPLLSIPLFIVACAETPVPVATDRGTSSAPEAPKTASDVKEDKVVFTTSHLPLEKWHRTADCCSATGKKIAIASGGTRSTACGMTLSGNGGNLVDAAVAVAFCLAVERPHSCGLGGGGFMTLHLAGKGDFFVDFRETAPGKATEKMYLDEKGAVIKDKSLDGGAAVATPGFVDGLYAIHQKYGSKPWKDVVAPAIELAAKGFPVYISLHEKIVTRKDALLKDEQLKKIFLPEGQPLAVGATLVQTALAGTLKTVAEKGRDGFYTGELAKAIADTARAQGGLLSVDDLKKYRTVWTKPMVGTFDGMKVLTAPPPSAGGMIILEVLNALSLYPLKGMSYSEYAHVYAEAEKRAFADRSKYIGDPDFYKDRTYEKLITPAYAKQLQKSISLTKATPSSEIRPADLSAKTESPDTTHLSLIDAQGNAVSSTITVNYYFGAAIAVPGTGLILNDEMDDFSSKPGEKNLFGLTGSEANKIEPGKRPVSSMTPTILLKNGKPVLAIGAPGGSHIISGVLGSILYMDVWFGGDIKKAVFSPRMHHQWIPDKLFVELKGLPEATQKRLMALGHTLEQPKFTSQVSAVAWDAQAKQYVAVFDPRDEGGAEAK